MNRIEDVQKCLEERGIDGWLLYDFRKMNELAHYFLSIPSNTVTTRRFFYWIPKVGKPIKLVHAIEEHALDSVPGEKRIYLSWQSLEKALKEILNGPKKIAMEYSPKNQIPYVSRVDAGTIDLIRSFGMEVVSSADLLALFTATLSERQIESHLRAAKALDAIVSETWKWIADQIKAEKPIREYDARQKICEEFKKRSLVTDHDPIVAVNANSADPHYEPLKEKSSPIQKGDFLLIDLWAKEKGDESIFADITRVAVLDKTPTDKQKKIFQIVRDAQKKAVELIRKRFEEKKRVEGREVDDAARGVIKEAGFELQFLHRTGHSIERTLHGSGAHIDNLEIQDTRALLPASCFSIEPGIYLKGEFGVRLEFDVLIHPDRRVEVTGGEQQEIPCLLP